MSRKTVVEQLRDWEKEHGRCWHQEIENIALSGGTWGSAADHFGVPKLPLRQFCHRRGFRYPWQKPGDPNYQPSVRAGQKANLYEYQGRQWTLRELSELSSIKDTTIYYRLNKGWSVEKAITTPVVHNGIPKWFTYRGERLTLRQLSERYRISKATLYSRLYRGWSIDQMMGEPVLSAAESGSRGGQARHGKWKPENDCPVNGSPGVHRGAGGAGIGRTPQHHQENRE